MDDLRFVIIGVALIILILGLSVAMRKLKRKANAWGEQKGKEFAAKRLPDALDKLATTLEFQADPTTVAEVINQVVAEKPKKAADAGAGTWHLTFAERDDIHLQLTQADGGSRLAVTKTVNFQDFPQGHHDWEKFRERLVAAAQARGIQTREGKQPHFVQILDPSGKETLLGDPAKIWVAPGN